MRESICLVTVIAWIGVLPRTNDARGAAEENETVLAVADFVPVRVIGLDGRDFPQLRVFLEDFTRTKNERVTLVFRSTVNSTLGMLRFDLRIGDYGALWNCGQVGRVHGQGVAVFRTPIDRRQKIEAAYPTLSPLARSSAEGVARGGADGHPQAAPPEIVLRVVLATWK